MGFGDEFFGFFSQDIWVAVKGEDVRGVVVLRKRVCDLAQFQNVAVDKEVTWRDSVVLYMGC